PIMTARSGLSVTTSCFSGCGLASALAAGKSTAISTVAKGAAIMKMMSSTSITSMNGVTLISCNSSSVSSPWSRRRLTTRLSLDGCGNPAPLRRLLNGNAAVEIAAYKTQHARRGVGMQRTIRGRPTRKDVVHDDRWNCRHQPECGRQQRFGNAGRDNRKIRGVLFGNADEAVHDAPYGAEQADKGRGCADGGEPSGPPDHAATGGCF